jgi:hypothetical protein
VHCATIFSIYFRFLFAMMSGWEILGLASFHLSIQPVFGTPSRLRRSRYTNRCFGSTRVPVSPLGG